MQPSTALRRKPPADQLHVHDEAVDVLPQQRVSVSARMYEHFNRRKIWRRGVVALYVASYVGYLFWRLSIINPHSLPLSLAYFAAEGIEFLLGLACIYTSWGYNHHTPPLAPRGLKVDVFVTTFKEPLHMIRRTAMAARAIDYPHTTWILDDGKRDEVQALAAELGINYLQRPDNKNAKAGNLNYGLAHTQGDFIASFDADHIPLPHALDVMLGFFTDPKVALVQTPQDYYNTRAFQYSNARDGGLWHDQSLYYGVVMPCGDSINAATCVGTGVVYRRAALKDIGGIPVDTVTEDLHTSLKLHKKGHRVLYVNEPVAYGFAEASLAEYYPVRHRWAHGNLHAIELENIFSSKGLTLAQRLQYLSMELLYLEGWQRLLIFAIPIISLLWGLQPFKISVFNILVVLSFPLYAYVLLQEISLGFTRFWASEILSMARWPVHIVAAAGFFRMKMPFRSAIKGGRAATQWKLTAPQLTLMVVSLGALIAGILQLKGNYTSGPLFGYLHSLVARASGAAAGTMPDIHVIMKQGYTVDLVAIAGFWALYNAVKCAFFVRKTLRDAKLSTPYYSFNFALPVLFDTSHATYGLVTQISEVALAFTDFRSSLPYAVGDDVALTLTLPTGTLSVKARVHSIKGNKVEATILWSSPAAQDQLANALYSVDWRRAFAPRHAYSPPLSEIILSVLRGRNPFAKENVHWQAVLFSQRDNMLSSLDNPQLLSGYGVMSRKVQDSEKVSFIAFQDFRQGDHCAGLVFTEKGLRPLHLTILDSEPLTSLATKGLDGAIARRYLARLAS